jgi:hypothetical protein
VTPWWGETEFVSGEARAWRVGPLRLHAWRRSREWWTHARVEGDWREQALDIAAPADRAALEGEEVTRFAVDTDTLALAPALPDRPVIVRPEREFIVPPGECAEIYVSVPLWLQLRLPPLERPLLDREIFPNKLTWFGPDPTQGSLCYASRTFARATLDDIVPRPHRAVTRVVLRNKNDARFTLERMQIPVKHLALYEKGGLVWTDDLYFEREAGDEDEPLELHDRDWHRAPQDATKIAPPREKATKGLLVSVFSPLFASRERTWS